MKKPLQIIATLLVAAVATGAAQAQTWPQTFTKDGIKYTVQSQNATDATVDGFTPDIPADVTIETPVTLNGKTYTNVKVNPVNQTSPLVGSGITKLTVKGNVAFGNYGLKGITTLTDADLSQFRSTTLSQSLFEECTSLSQVTLPAGVTSLGENCFKNTALTSFEVPAGVERITNQFYGCSKLTTLTFPQNTKIKTLKIGGSRGTAITSIDVPASVTLVYFKDMASLETVVFPETTTEETLLSSHAFSGCTALKSITLPSGISRIPQQSFNGCSALESVNIPSTVKSIASSCFNGCAALQTISLDADNSLEQIGASAFVGCGSLKGSLNLPKVTTIDNSAFSNCSIEGVTVSDKLVKLGQNAFKGSGIKSFVIPSSLKTLNSSTFENCASLESVTFPEEAGPTVIPTSLFQGSGLSEIVFPDYITSMTANSGTVNCVSNCKQLTRIVFPANPAFKTVPRSFASSCGNVAEVVLPENITSIGENAFAGNKIVNVVLPKGLDMASCGSNIFQNNLVESIEWPEEFTTIPAGMFQNCKLDNMQIPAGVTSIGKNAFDGNPIASLQLNDGLQTIGVHAFSGTSATYTDVDIPSSVTAIGDYAFANSLKKVTFKADEPYDQTGRSYGMFAFGNTNQLTDVYSMYVTPPTIVVNTFTGNTYSNAMLHVWADKDGGQNIKDAYKQATGWSKFLKVDASVPVSVDGIFVEDAEAETVYYDLTGIRVDRPVKGQIYIVNGKKVVM